MRYRLEKLKGVLDAVKFHRSVSRAREVCVRVGQREELSKAIRRNRQHKRFTHLTEMLQ